MAEASGPFKSRHGVSRQTMVLRKAKEDDARRVAERDGEEPSGDHNAVSRRLKARGALNEDPAVSGRRNAITTASGRRVVVHHEGGVSARLTSTRLTGEQAASVRVAGGDTIIRYKSGDMVIRRGARRARLRRQVIWTYAAGYLALFGLYVYFLLTSTASVTPHEFIEKAFSRRESTDIIALERAAMEVMRGNRTPAEIRMAEALSFQDENKEIVHVAAGDRLTLLNAAKLGRAIIEDEKKPEALRTFAKPFRIYKETFLAGLNWPWWLTFYNALGFFLLLILFLWRPLMHYLGTQGKKTAVALGNARNAQQEAADYREKYRRLAVEVADRGDELRAFVADRSEKERGEALKQANYQVQEISGGVEGALADEATQLSCRMGAEVARAACDRARDLLAERLGPREHDVAIEELIADIAGMKFTS